MQDETTAEHSEDAPPEEGAETEAASGESAETVLEPTEEAGQVVEEVTEAASELEPERAEEQPEQEDAPESTGEEVAAVEEPEAESFLAAAAALQAKTPAEREMAKAQEAVAPEDLLAAIAPEGGDEETGPPAAELPEAEEPEAGEPEEEEDVDERPVLIVPPPDDGIKRRWYAIHAHSGQEGNVQAALRVKAEQVGLKDMITNVFVPMEEVAEYKSGEKRLSKRKFFPGYVLVQLPEHPERNADLWHLIKDTPGVTGFIGSRTEPVPLEDSEVMTLAEEMRGERERPRPKVAYEVGERVKIIDGAFANFMGNIGEINEERAKMKVLIEIFERQTNVEVEFWQVEKL